MEQVQRKLFCSKIGIYVLERHIERHIMSRKVYSKTDCIENLSFMLKEFPLSWICVTFCCVSFLQSTFLRAP